MPSRVVTKRRVKRRQQRLVSKNVKRKARTVRTLRKHRKSVKKVMRGGEPPIIHEIFLANNSSTPVIKLTISLPKGIFSSTYTFNIEINLDLYKGDVRKLLKILFESGGGLVDFDPNDEKIRSSFLLGLADIPEQQGTINWALNQAYKKGVRDSMILDIEQKANQAKNGMCFIVMEASKKGNFTVKKYSQISYNTTDVEFTEYCTNDDRNDGICYINGTVRVRETLYYPVLNLKGNTKWGRGIDFINWSSKTRPIAYSNVENKCKFSVMNTKDMSSFVENLKIYTILNLEGEDAKDLAAPKLPETITADTSKDTDYGGDKADV